MARDGLYPEFAGAKFKDMNRDGLSILLEGEIAGAKFKDMTRDGLSILLEGEIAGA